MIEKDKTFFRKNVRAVVRAMRLNQDLPKVDELCQALLRPALRGCQIFE